LGHTFEHQNLSFCPPGVHLGLPASKSAPWTPLGLHFDHFLVTFRGNDAGNYAGNNTRNNVRTNAGNNAGNSVGNTDGNHAGNNAGHNTGNNGGLLGSIRNQQFDYGYLLGLLVVFDVWDLRCVTDEAMLAAAD